MLRSTRGNYSTIFALSATVLLGFAAMSIDFFRVRSAQHQAQNIADISAMAALTELKESGDYVAAKDWAKTIIQSNWVSEDKGGIANTITFGTWNWDARSWTDGGVAPNAVKVEVARSSTATNGEVPLWIAPSFGGPDSANVEGQSIGAMRYREIMVVLDITMSFYNEFPDARAAVLALLDYIEQQSIPGDKVGMVVFVSAGVEYTPLQLLEGNYTDIRADWAQLDTCNRWEYTYWYYYYYYGWTETDYQNDRGHYAPQMPRCFIGADEVVPGVAYRDPTYQESNGAYPYYTDSGTSQGHGIALAESLLNASGDDSALKTIVLVSDGRPQCTNGDTACDNQRVQYASDTADDAWDNSKIHIWSVSFNDPYNATQSALMESLAKGFGNFYETPDSSELPQILEDIAKAIPIAVVQ